MTQHEVASHFGVFYNTITLWEKGKTEPGVERYPAIAAFLGYFPWEVDTSTLGGKIKLYRYVHGVSRNELGRQLGVDGSAVCHYERNTKQPLPKTMEKLEAMLAALEK